MNILGLITFYVSILNTDNDYYAALFSYIIHPVSITTLNTDIIFLQYILNLEIFIISSAAVVYQNKLINAVITNVKLDTQISSVLIQGRGKFSPLLNFVTTCTNSRCMCMSHSVPLHQLLPCWSME